MTDAKPLSQAEREQIAECLSVETVLPDYFGALTEIARIKGLLGKAMRSEAFYREAVEGRTKPVQVWIVKTHNPTSGKGGYGLFGVFWTLEAAQAATAKAPGTRCRYTIHRFTEHEQIQIALAEQAQVEEEK